MKTQACLNDNHDFYGPGGGSRRLLKVFPNSVVRDNARISQQKCEYSCTVPWYPGYRSNCQICLGSSRAIFLRIWVPLEYRLRVCPGTPSVWGAIAGWRWGPQPLRFQTRSPSHLSASSGDTSTSLWNATARMHALVQSVLDCVPS